MTQAAIEKEEPCISKPMLAELPAQQSILLHQQAYADKRHGILSYSCRNLRAARTAHLHRIRCTCCVRQLCCQWR
jgi:hypothetical protein